MRVIKYNSTTVAVVVSMVLTYLAKATIGPWNASMSDKYKVLLVGAMACITIGLLRQSFRKKQPSEVEPAAEPKVIFVPKKVSMREKTLCILFAIIFLLFAAINTAIHHIAKVDNTSQSPSVGVK